MKKFLIFTIMVVVLSMCMMTVCFAEAPIEETVEVTESIEILLPETAPKTENGEMSYGEKEEIVKNVLNELLAKGSEVFEGMEWWEVLSTWVRANFDAVIVFVGGFFSLCCVIYYKFCSNPKLKQYVNSVGTSCKGWFEKIDGGVNGIITSLWSFTSKITLLVEKVDVLLNMNLLTVNTLEDVIKLSGADEGKKEIYLINIEAAKKEYAKIYPSENKISQSENKESGNGEV